MPNREEATPVQRLTRDPLLPVITVHNADEADALIDLSRVIGIDAVEILLRDSYAFDAIERIAASGIYVAAGTVRTVSDVAEASARGASAIVSAGFTPTLVSACADFGLFYLPGVATPTEILAAAEYGLETLKYFPAEALGGVKTLSAYAGPFPNTRFIATGGISSENFSDYLGLNNVLAVGGSWMMPLQTPAFSRGQVAEKIRNEISLARTLRSLTEGENR